MRDENLKIILPNHLQGRQLDDKVIPYFVIRLHFKSK